MAVIAFLWLLSPPYEEGLAAISFWLLFGVVFLKKKRGEGEGIWLGDGDITQIKKIQLKFIPFKI